MPDWIYVTGFHRAGTHGFAEYKAEQLGVRNIEERVVDFNDMKRLKKLTGGIIYKKKYEPVTVPDLVGKGFVCQCPMAAAQAEQLAEWGKVYWVTRNHEQIITSMVNGGFTRQLWDIMRTFREQWPDDPVWQVLEYDGRQDVHYGFVGYATLVVKVKDYLHEKYLKDVAEKIVTEEQPYYNPVEAISLKNALRPKAREYMQWYTQYWEEIHAGLCVD